MQSPVLLTATKEELVTEDDVWSLGDKHTWALEEHNIHQLLELIEVDAKKETSNG